MAIDLATFVIYGVKMVSVDVIWLFSVLTYVAFSCHFVAPHPTLHLYKSACSIGYASKTI